MNAPADPAPDELALAAEFPAAARGDWQRLVSAVLERSGGPAGDPEAALSTPLPDGIVLAPLYTPADAGADAGLPGQAPFVRGRTATGNRGGWDVRARNAHPDPETANAQILEELEGGANSLWLTLGEGRCPVDALPALLADVMLDLVTVVLDAGAEARPAAERFLAVAADRWVNGPDVVACLGLDPLGRLARTGDASAVSTGLADATTLALHASRYLPNVRTLVVDGLAYHEAGATDAQELGATLAAGVEYLRAMGAAGIPTEEALGQLEFRYAATADQFATIAKLRAARRVWSKVASECGVPGPEGGQRQHAVTSWTMTTRRDPWNNILRGTLAACSAGVGGADAITVLPFDAALGLPDALARRVARNTSALLVEEAHVAQVVDPAGGSWYVESLTDSLAQRAWAFFQDLERAGGCRAALASGLVGDRIAGSREARRAALAQRREAVTGVSSFPLRGEKLLERQANPSLTVRHRSCEWDALTPGQELGDGGLPRIRWAQWHEELRDRSDVHAAATGSAPALPVLTLGAARASAACAAELASVLGPAGVTTTALTAIELGGAAAGGRAPRVVAVCCGPDTTPDEVTAAVAAVRNAGASWVVLAGSAALATASGADAAVGPDTDVVAFGTRVLDLLGVS